MGLVERVNTFTIIHLLAISWTEGFHTFLPLNLAHQQHQHFDHRLDSEFCQTLRKTILRSTLDDDLSRQLSKAKDLLAQAKLKLATRDAENKKAEEGEGEGAFHDTKIETDENRAELNGKSKPKSKSHGKDHYSEKSKMEQFESGKVRANGDVMALLSEDEDWELKDLLEMFDEENSKEERDVDLSRKERDIARSMFNMRMAMRNEDYETIFDKRNRFIGED